MNAVVRALFDDAAITGAQAAGLKDTSTGSTTTANSSTTYLMYVSGLSFFVENFLPGIL